MLVPCTDKGVHSHQPYHVIAANAANVINEDGIIHHNPSFVMTAFTLMCRAYWLAG